ncbi:hypothetical protein [Kibdelosporangium philippinense]|uniref:hypothetical protein n=1 Tax=Kibdelosporangium philippinense TaxID=211113 RepID=UPI003607896A
MLIAIGAVVAALAVAGRKPRVEVARDVYPDRVERGSRAGLTLRVYNQEHGGSLGSRLWIAWAPVLEGCCTFVGTQFGTVLFERIAHVGTWST